MIKNDFVWLVKEIPGPPRHYSSIVAATVVPALPATLVMSSGGALAVTHPISVKAMGRLSTAAPNAWI